MKDDASILSGVVLVPVREILLYMQSDRYMDKRGLTEYTTLSPRFIESHLGEIPHYRPNGKKLLFKKSEIDKWLETYHGRQDVVKIADEAIARLRAK